MKVLLLNSVNGPDCVAGIRIRTLLSMINLAATCTFFRFHKSSSLLKHETTAGNITRSAHVEKHCCKSSSFLRLN